MFQISKEDYNYIHVTLEKLIEYPTCSFIDSVFIQYHSYLQAAKEKIKGLVFGVSTPLRV